MKMRTHRLAGLVLAAALLLGLSACGKAPAPAPAASSGEEEPIHLTIGIQSKSNIADYENNALTKWLEEQTGYDLEFKVYSSTSSEMKTQFSTEVAGGEKLPDIMLYFPLSAEERNVYGKDGYFVDLATYFDDEEVMKNYDYDDYIKGHLCQDQLQRLYTSGRDAAGHWYGFPCAGSSSNSDRPRNMLYINQSWLDKLGLEMPRTFDELVHVLREFINKDPNGNGVADEMGMVGSTNIARGDIPSWIINQYIYLNDIYLYNCTDDGEIYLPYDREEYRQGIRDVKYLYDEGLIAPMTWTIKDTSELPAIFTPADNVARCGVFAGHIQLRVTTDSPIVWEYQPLPPLEGACAAIEPLSIVYYTFITTDCEHPDAAFDLLCTLASEEGTLRQRYGEKDVDWIYAEDWETGRKGIKVLNSNAYSGETTSTYGYNCVTTFWSAKTWEAEHGQKYTGQTYTQVDPVKPENDEVTWSGMRGNLGVNHGEAYLAAAEANNPKNIVYTLIYTDEELEKLGNAKSDIQTYVKEARAHFITGELDIDSDKDWQAYCDTLHSLGTEAFIQAGQAAWDRQQALLNN